MIPTGPVAPVNEDTQRRLIVQWCDSRRQSAARRRYRRPARVPVPAVPSPGAVLAAQRWAYIDLLLRLADRTNGELPPDELLDRIERVLDHEEKDGSMVLQLAYLVTCDVPDCGEMLTHPVRSAMQHNAATRAAVEAGWHHSGHNGAFTCPVHAGTPVRLIQ